MLRIVINFTQIRHVIKFGLIVTFPITLRILKLNANFRTPATLENEIYLLLNLLLFIVTYHCKNISFAKCLIKQLPQYLFK